MNNYHFCILLAAFVLFGCAEKPKDNRGNTNLTKYYTYNPQDTIGNEPYWQLLRIDSARVEYTLEHPMGLPPSARIEEREDSSLVVMKDNESDRQIYDTAEAKWHELMKLCSQKQHEEALSLYIKKESDIGIALATTTNKFELDYYVIGKLLFDQLAENEAAEIMIKFLEFDKTMTENVILLGESQSGFVPPHYAALINFLGRMYTIAGQKEKAEEQIEPFRKAVYMLYDDVWQNEMSIADFKINIYSSFDDSEKMKETIIEHRNFVIQYAKDTGEDYSEQINRMNALIKQLEMASEE